MKRLLSIMMLATFLLFAVEAVAQDKAVVIPLWKTDPNIVSENICSGVTILGVTGTMICPGIQTVTSATGRIWMDRNLGASQVATSVTDAEAYGDLYQWGRLTDGHEKYTTETTTTLSTTDAPGHGSLILNSVSPYDWRNPQNDNLWQGATGTNNPCPSGFRLPTRAEWETEIASWSSQDANGAFSSPLKLVMAGYRFGTEPPPGGIFSSQGTYGYYWSSTVNVNGTDADYMYFSSVEAAMDYAHRVQGSSVRCIKD